MNEGIVVKQTPTPNTRATLRRDFEQLGVKSGSTVIMHSAMSKLGWTVGGPMPVIQAMMDMLTPAGTLVMPSHSSDNSDPAHWQNPPIPQDWWQIVYDEWPAFDPATTPTRQMGIIAETFRRWPGVVRSYHPTGSFAAWGQHAEWITTEHQLNAQFGERSPLARIYDLDGQVLLLGVVHGNNTSLHLAEHRSNYWGKALEKQGSAILVNGERRWVAYDMLAYDADDFEQCGADYETSIGYIPGKVGQAEARLISQRGVVDFGMRWLEQNRRPQASA